jgi:trimeric autotransporter adhesin
LATNPVDFNWKTQRDEDGNGKSDVGFIAQEIELVIPEVVTGEEGNKGISYGNLVAIAFKAIQEQQTQIEALQSEINLLKGE